MGHNLLHPLLWAEQGGILVVICRPCTPFSPVPSPALQPYPHLYFPAVLSPTQPCQLTPSHAQSHIQRLIQQTHRAPTV
jgi:hypothetical protein